MFRKIWDNRVRDEIQGLIQLNKAHFNFQQLFATCSVEDSLWNMTIKYSEFSNYFNRKAFSFILKKQFSRSAELVASLSDHFLISLNEF